MAVSVGYAVMPVIPSFDNISREIDKQISGPLSKASKQAGDALEKGVGAKIEQLGDRAERSAYRQKKAQDELTAAVSKREAAILNEQAAQQKLESAVSAVGAAQEKATRSVDAALESYEKLRQSGKASADELAAAEQKITDARTKGQADVERKEIAVTNARKGMVTATQGVVDAENGYVRALRESERASEAAEVAAKEYADAQERGITMMDRVRDSASRMGSSIAEAAEKYKVHATVALGAIGALGKGAMDYASEAEQSYGAVESIFGAHADAITAKSKEAAEAVGLSGREYRELSSLTGAMLKNMGMPMDEVTDKTQELVGVASDLSATFGGSTKDAIEAVNALLRGEADPIERYGVSIKKTDVNARLAAKGLDQLEGEALKQAEAQELLGLLMEQTADAQGQFARETDTAAHKQQVATAKMDDAREVIGTALLPVMAELMDMGARIAEVVGEHPRLILGVAGAVGTLAAALVGIATVAPALEHVGPAFKAMTGPVGLAVAGVAALTGGLTWFFTQTERGQQIWQGFTDKIKVGIEAVQVAWEELTAAFQGGDWGFGQLAEWFGEDRAEAIVNTIGRIGQAFRGIPAAFEEIAAAFQGGDWGFGQLAEWFGEDRAEAIVNTIGRIGQAFRGIPAAFEEIAAAFQGGDWGFGQLAEWFGDDAAERIVDGAARIGEAWTALKKMAGDVAGSLVSVLRSLWGMVKAVGGALFEVAKAVAPVLIPVLKVVAGLVGGTLYAAFHALVGAVKIAAGVIGGLAKAFAWVIENALAPFVSAIAGVVSWVAEKLPGAISAAADWLQSAFQKIGGFFRDLGDAIKSVWSGVIMPVFQAFVTAGQWLVGIIGTVVLTPLILAWEAMSWAIKAAWEKIIKPAWDAVAAGAQWLWNNALKPTFDLIVAGWNALGDAFRWVYDNAIKPVWDALVWVAQSAWDGVNVIFGWLQAGWEALGAGMRWVNENVIQPVWDGFAAGLTWLHDTVVAPVTGWIAEKWQQMGNALETVKTFVVDTVFGGLKSGLDAVQNWFNSIVDAIGSKWNELRGHLAKPINFMINTVYNDGILRAWNVIAGILPGLNKGDRLAGIPGYATGGRIKGPGTGTSDDILAWLSNGEHVWTAREVQAIGGHNVLDALRDAILHRRGFTFDGAHATLLPGRVNNRVGDLAGAAPDLLPKFARGGRVDDSKIRPLWELQLMKAHEFAKAQHGKPYQWAGPTGPGTSFDCSGFMGAIAATIQDTNPWQRYWATMSFPSPGAQGFVPGLGAGFSVGMFNGGPWGGHTAGTLSAVGPYSAVNVESGGSPSMVKYGVGAVGADDRQFTMHYHLPIGADGGFVSGGTGGVDPEVMRSRIAETLHKAINVVMDPIKGQLPAPPPAWLGIPGGVFDAGRDGLVGFVDNGVKALGDGLGTVFTAVSEGAESLVDRGRDAVGAAMNFLGARVFDRGGVLRKGQMAVNLGNADEHVISEKSFQNFSFGASVLGVAAQEILEAFRGGDFGYGALAEVLRDEEWAKAIVDGAANLGKIADYNSLEGIAARSFASEMAGIAGMLGGDTISSVTTSLLGAEREIWDARTASADRLADIAAKERALEEARKAADKLAAESPELSVKDQRKLADAEEALARARKDAESATSSNAKSEEARAKAKEKSDQKVADAEKKLARVREDLGVKEGETAEKRAEDIEKANEQVVKAEQELAAARKASAKALDIPIFDVAPQISGMLSQAAAATAAVPAVSNALAGLAAAAGPAGVTVGVALQAVKVGIDTVQKVGSAIGDFVGRIFDARAKTYSNMVTVLNLQHEWAKMVDEQAAKVVELRVAWVEAQVALRDATWKTRLAQADVVRAQLQGVKTVAEAEAKLEAERKRVAKAALGHFDDLSLAYDRYRWAEYQGMVERLGVQAAVTPEILALEAEVNVAKLNALAAQKQASLDALQASWEQQKAALALMQTQQQLALQTQQLAVMQREFFGMSQADSLQAMNTMMLRQELAEVQSQVGKNSWRLSYWLTGAHRADKQRAADLRAQIAEREGSGAGVNVGGTGGLMSFFGYGDSALNAAKNAGYGKAERAMFEAQEQQALLQIEQQKQQLQQQIEQSRLFEQYQQQIGALTAEIESLRTGAAAAQYTADYYREENPAVKAANLALARFEADRSAQYAAVGRGEKQVVEITIPEQDVYTREQMDLVLRSVQEIPELDARIRKVETPATPGANAAMRSMIGG